MRPPRCPPLQGWIPHPVLQGLFRRAGVVEHLFGDIDSLLITRRPRTQVRWCCNRSGTPCRLWLESYRAEAPKAEAAQVTVIDKCGQALKGVWWMSWHREAKKDVVACDKLREAGKRALIRRFPNEETRVGLLPLTCR